MLLELLELQKALTLSRLPQGGCDREKIAEELYQRTRKMFPKRTDWGFESWDDMPKGTRESWLEYTDAILALTRIEGDEDLIKRMAKYMSEYRYPNHPWGKEYDSQASNESWRRSEKDWIMLARQLSNRVIFPLTKSQPQIAPTNDKGEQLLPILLTRREFIDLPMDIRRRTLARQVDKIAYQDKGMCE